MATTTAEQRVAALRSELRTSENKVSALEWQLNSASSHHRASLSDLDLNQVAALDIKSPTVVDQLLRDKRTANSQLKKLRSENFFLGRLLDELKQENPQLKIQLQNAEDQAKTNADQLQAKAAEVDQLKTACLDFNYELEALRKAHDALRRDFAEQQQRLSAQNHLQADESARKTVSERAELLAHLNRIVEAAHHDSRHIDSHPSQRRDDVVLIGELEAKVAELNARAHQLHMEKCELMEHNWKCLEHCGTVENENKMLRQEYYKMQTTVAEIRQMLPEQTKLRLLQNNKSSPSSSSSMPNVAWSHDISASSSAPVDSFSVSTSSLHTSKVHRRRSPSSQDQLSYQDDLDELISIVRQREARTKSVDTTHVRALELEARVRELQIQIDQSREAEQRCRQQLILHLSAHTRKQKRFADDTARAKSQYEQLVSERVMIDELRQQRDRAASQLQHVRDVCSQVSAQTSVAIAPSFPSTNVDDDGQFVRHTAGTMKLTPSKSPRRRRRNNATLSCELASPTSSLHSISELNNPV